MGFVWVGGWVVEESRAALIWETFPEPRQVRELKSKTCIGWVGGWVGGWVIEKEENEAVGMSCWTLWVEEDEAVGMKCCGWVDKAFYLLVGGSRDFESSRSHQLTQLGQ